MKFGDLAGYSIVSPRSGKKKVQVKAGKTTRVTATYKKSSSGGGGATKKLDIKQGKAPTIDGALSNNEWSDAGSVQLVHDSSTTITVYYKHDASNLYLAFSNLPKNVWPEVLIDVNNDKSSSWKSDDWWLHVSNMDCEGNGEHTVWDACVANGTGWEANNNPFNSGLAELRISYAHIGFVPGDGKSLGIAFVVNVFSDYGFYPSTAAMDNPSTWDTATSSDGW